MDRYAAERKRAEMTAAADAERQRQLGVSAAAEMKREQAKEPRVYFGREATFLNLALMRKIVGGGQPVELPVYNCQGQESVRADELEGALDSGRFGIGRIGRLEILRIRTVNDADVWTLAELGFRAPSGVQIADNSLDLRRWFEVGGGQGGRMASEIVERYRGGPRAFASGEDLARILPAEVCIDWGRRSLVYIRALPEAAAPEPEPATAGAGDAASGAPAPLRGPAPPLMREVEMGNLDDDGGDAA